MEKVKIFERLNGLPLTHAYVHWLADVHLAGFAPAFTLSLCDSERSRKPPMPIASVVRAYFKKIDMKRIIIILTISLFYSCQTKKNDLNQSDKEKQVGLTEKYSGFLQVNDEFTSYLDNFKKVELPISIKGCLLTSDGLKEIDGKKFDKYNPENSYAYRQIPTNGTYLATITLGIADCYLPVLTTYKPNGEIIDKKTIAIGGCGSDCGFTCEEFMKIDKDYKIYTSDTISTYECDSLGNEISGTYKYYVAYKTGMLTTEGKIVLSNEKKKKINGRKNTP